jgi:mannose-6-phosphate isomerase
LTPIGISSTWLMHLKPLYPLRFQPILKRLLWGGRRLGAFLDKPLGDEHDYAESWEISDHRHDISVVEDGPLAGTDLRNLVAERSTEILGPKFTETRQFPLLVKFLDANRDLSVQVHPDDARGRVLADDNGKTEAWVVIHAEPGSLIYAGLNAGVTRADLAHAMETGRVEPLLHRFEAKAGDCVMIPAGTIHAIGAGIVLAEIQQMSDATFRVFDWGRVGPDGSPRALHAREALESTDFEAGPVHPLKTRPQILPTGTKEPLASCDYFAIERFTLTGPISVGSSDRFTILLGLSGSSDVIHEGESHPLLKGQTRLLPAAIGCCEVRPRGEAVLLTCVVP